MGAFVAIINVPGYSPWADEVPTFSTAKAAWEYLREEIERQELAYEPVEKSDPDGPQQLTLAALTMESYTAGDYGEGTIYGPSWIAGLDEADASLDLGLAYSVMWSDDIELCTECGTDLTIDKGEGYDGLCGNCADRAETEGRWSDTETSES